MPDQPTVPRARDVPRRTPRVPALLFLALALLWLALLYQASGAAPQLPLPALLGLLALLALPLAASGIYLSSIRQIRRLTAFSRRGILATLLAGRALRTALWTLWAVFASLFLIVELGAYQPVEWLALFLLIPVFYLVFAFFRSLSRAELRPYLATASPITLACLVTPFLMLPLYVLVRQHLADEPGWDTLGEALAAARQRMPAQPTTPLMAEASGWVSYLAALKAYIVSRIASLDPTLSPYIVALTQWVVFVNGCLILACFTIPLSEYRRLFAPPLDSDLPPPATAGRTLSLLAATTLFAALALYLVARADRWTAEDPRPAEWRAWVESQITIAVEWVEGAPYRPGTLAQINELKLRAAASLEPVREEMLQEIDAAFDLATSNVDTFLDWYYSLGGEYARTAKMMAGQLESHAGEVLAEKLELATAFAGIDEKLAELTTLQAEVAATYQRELDQLLAANRLDLPESQKFIDVSPPAFEFRELPQPSWATKLEARLGFSFAGGLAAGAASAILTKSLTQRLLGGAAFKRAVQAAVRIVATKVGGRLAGAGAGAVAGGAAGSVVPGVGNVVGGIIGAVVGLATAVGIDKLALEIEQAINREEFKDEIIAALDEERSKLKSLLLPPAEPGLP